MLGERAEEVVLVLLDHVRRIMKAGGMFLMHVPNGESPCRLLVRILWTCAIGDDMFENGGSFLEVLADPAGHLKVLMADSEREVS